MTTHVTQRGQVAFIDPGQEELVYVPASEAKSAESRGLIPADADIVAAHKAAPSRESLVSDESSALLSGLRGVTGGLSDLLLTKTGLFSPGELRQASVQNPLGNPLAEVAGTIGGALVGPAAGLGRLAAGSLARTGIRGALPSLAARSAGEAAFIGGGQQISALSLSDQSVDTGTAVKRVIGSAATGAALGAGLSLGFMGIGKAVGGFTKTAGKRTAISRAIDRLDETHGAHGTLPDTLDAKRIILQQKRADQGTIMRELRKLRKTEITPEQARALSDLEISDKLLGKQINRLTRELSEIQVRGSAVPRGTRRAAGKRRVADGVSVKPGPQSGAIHKAHEDVLTEMDDINVAINELRTLVRRQDAAGIVPSARHRQLRQTFEVRRAELRRANDIMQRQIAAQQRVTFFQQGQAFKAAGLDDAISGPPRTTTEWARESIDETAAILAATNKLRVPTDVADSLRQAAVPAELSAKISNRASLALGGMLFAGAPGAFAAFIGAPLARRALAPAIQGALKLGARATTGQATKLTASLRNLSVRGLSGPEIKDMGPAINHESNDPLLLQDMAQRAYLDAGLSLSSAEQLAEFQADRAQILRDAYPQNLNDPAQRASFSRTFAATSNPQGIVARLGENQLSFEDAQVMRAMFPAESEALAEMARSALRSGERIPPSKRRQLELLAAPNPRTAEQKWRELIQRIQQGYQPGQGIQRRGSARLPSERTRVQQLGG